MSILIKNGRVINPSDQTDRVIDIYVEDGIIKEKEGHIEKEASTVIDASGCYVMPGLIDMHVHFRDPGFTRKEDVQTGSLAASRGGFTTVCCMPNTNPVTDSVEVVEYIIKKAKEFGKTNVLPVGSVTKSMAGKELTDIFKLKEAGICAISEDGKSVMDSGLYRKAMYKAKEAGLPVLAHCEDATLVNGGVMNLCDRSRELGLRGISNAVENIIEARDIMLAKETGARLHLCHCSTKESVKMLKAAKEEGIDVTAEVCPHHFSLCTDDIKSNDANFKMNPPLRKREDMETLKEGLRDDIMDVISTDHAPHAMEEKSGGFENSPFGITGLETSVALTVTNLLLPGYITPMQMAEKMSYNPAKILKIKKGTLDIGSDADITIIDPKEEWTVDPSRFASKGKNTPFSRMRLNGRVKHTILAGEVVYDD